MIVERLYGMGGLAVRRERWEAVHELTTRRPPRLERRHYESWLRHGLTMGARSQQLQEQRCDQRVELSLINLAREQVIQLGCLRPDGIHADDEAILNSLVQFDALQGLVCLAQAQQQNDRSAFFTNCARFRTDRVEPAIVRLISDPGMRFQIGQVERVALLRFVDRRLAPAAISQKLRGFEPVGVAPGLVAGDVPPELSERHPVLADGYIRKASRASSRTSRRRGSRRRSG